jgi:hypothetical protein
VKRRVSIGARILARRPDHPEHALFQARENRLGEAEIARFSIVTAGKRPYAPAAMRAAWRGTTHLLVGGHPMAAKKKAAAKASGGDLIISKSRTKAAAKKCNVGSEFYGALDKRVRAIIAEAEARATGNKRKTLKAVDL